MSAAEAPAKRARATSAEVRAQQLAKVALLERAGQRCEVCGWGPPDTIEATRVLQAAHVVPWASGGPTVPENMVLLCPNHHAIYHAAFPQRRVIAGRPRESAAPVTRADLIAKLQGIDAGDPIHDLEDHATFRLAEFLGVSA